MSSFALTPAIYFDEDGRPSMLDDDRVMVGRAAVLPVTPAETVDS